MALSEPAALTPARSEGDGRRRTRPSFGWAWTFLLCNYLYCDLLSLMDADHLRGYLAGDVNGMKVTDGFLLGASVLMEIPIAMILVSGLVPWRVARWCQVGAGAFMVVVQLGSLFMGTQTGYYVFFSVIEVAAAASIAVVAWRGRGSR